MTTTPVGGARPQNFVTNTVVANLVTIALAAIAVFIVWACWVPAEKVITDARTPTHSAEAMVKVILPNGSGSGVHIGNGYILTAGHVAAGQTTVDVKMSDGVKVSASVLWMNKDYDIAMLRVSPDLHIKTSPLTCAPMFPGQQVEAAGNPMDLEFIKVRGIVAGVGRPYGPWHEVVPVDMVIIQGMSGGPTFDVYGNTVGINVGVMATPVESSGGMPMAGADGGIGYVVPSSAICELLARQ